MFASFVVPRSLLSFLVLFAAVGAVAAEPAKPIRVGMIGLDAHAVPFTKIITDPKTESPIKDMQVVAAVAAFSRFRKPARLASPTRRCVTAPASPPHTAQKDRSMSYCLVPFLVDLNGLRATIGSTNQAMIDAIRSRCQERLDYEENRMTRGTAVSRLIMGEPLDCDESNAYHYGYALKEICEQIGAVASNYDLWCGVRSWGVLEECQVANVLLQTGPPIPLPPTEDVPTIGHLPYERIDEMLSQMGDQHLTNPDGDLQDLLSEFASWLREARAKRKSLVLFYH